MVNCSKNSIYRQLDNRVREVHPDFAREVTPDRGMWSDSKRCWQGPAGRELPRPEQPGCPRAGPSSRACPTAGGSRAAGGTGTAPAPGIGHLPGDKDRPRPGWDLGLWVAQTWQDPWRGWVGLWGAGDRPRCRGWWPQVLPWGPGPWVDGGSPRGAAQGQPGPGVPSGPEYLCERFPKDSTLTGIFTTGLKNQKNFHKINRITR